MVIKDHKLVTIKINTDQIHQILNIHLKTANYTMTTHRLQTKINRLQTKISVVLVN